MTLLRNRKNETFLRQKSRLILSKHCQKIIFLNVFKNISYKTYCDENGPQSKFLVIYFMKVKFIFALKNES